jgi:hypothetical protein
MNDAPMTPDDNRDAASIRMSDHLAAVCQRPASHPRRASAIRRLAWAIAAVNVEEPTAPAQRLPAVA